MKTPRKLLIVRRDPPFHSPGWNVMLEIDGERTRSVQLPEELGAAVMLAAQAAILDVLVQQKTGVHPVPSTRAGSVRKGGRS